MDSFWLGARNSSVSTELRAGLTTFLAVAYIIVVNPLILEAGGVPVSAAVTATCVGAGIMTIAMGLFSNRPLAGVRYGHQLHRCVYTLCGGMGLGWQTAILSSSSRASPFCCWCSAALRDHHGRRHFPAPRYHPSALGLFIAMIGLKDGGIIVANEATMVSLGAVTDPVFLVGLISIVATVVLSSMNVKGALLWGILIAAVCGIPLGVTAAPSSIVAPLDFTTFGAPFQADADGVMGVVKAITTPSLLLFAFSLMMSDFFDTMGTAMAVAKQGEFLTDDGKVEDIKPILIVDSVAAIAGGALGASSITTFVESASGAADGGRSGLTSVFAGILFLLAAFFSPVISCISSAATCGALVYVGFLMMSDVVDIDWSDILEGFPTFMIIAGIPFTYSISNGIGLGFIAYVVVATVTGQFKKVRPLMWVAAIAFLLYFLML